MKKYHIASGKGHWNNILILCPVSQTLAKVMHLCKKQNKTKFECANLNVARGVSIIYSSLWTAPIDKRNVFSQCGINECLDRVWGPKLSSMKLLSRDSLVAKVLQPNFSLLLAQVWLLVILAISFYLL